jgi:hypothetical protein
MAIAQMEKRLHTGMVGAHEEAAVMAAVATTALADIGAHLPLVVHVVWVRACRLI